MNRSFRDAILLLAGLTLTACSSAAAPRPSHSPAQPSSAPTAAAAPFLFPQDSHEAKVFRSLAREQDGRLSACAHDRSCARAHFTRALLYLSENQGLAERHFQEVVAISPKSPLASLSVSWLRLLKGQSIENRHEAIVAQTTQWLIQDLWSREQDLKEELHTRGKKLEELSAQIEALKQIDAEMNEKPHPMRPKSKVTQPATQQD